MLCWFRVLWFCVIGCRLLSVVVLFVVFCLCSDCLFGLVICCMSLGVLFVFDVCLIIL